MAPRCDRRLRSYSFSQSRDFIKAGERGSVASRLIGVDSTAKVLLQEAEPLGLTLVEREPKLHPLVSVSLPVSCEVYAVFEDPTPSISCSTSASAGTSSSSSRVPCTTPCSRLSASSRSSGAHTTSPLLHRTPTPLSRSQGVGMGPGRRVAHGEEECFGRSKEEYFGRSNMMRPEVKQRMG
jgi:hypothetical protein